MVQPTLHAQFLKKCEESYKSVSEKLRELMAEYIRNDKENKDGK